MVDSALYAIKPRERAVVWPWHTTANARRICRGCVTGNRIHGLTSLRETYLYAHRVSAHHTTCTACWVLLGLAVRSIQKSRSSTVTFLVLRGSGPAGSGACAACDRHAGRRRLEPRTFAIPAAVNTRHHASRVEPWLDRPRPRTYRVGFRNSDGGLQILAPDGSGCRPWLGDRMIAQFRPSSHKCPRRQPCGRPRMPVRFTAAGAQYPGSTPDRQPGSPPARSAAASGPDHGLHRSPPCCLPTRPPLVAQSV